MSITGRLLRAASGKLLLTAAGLLRRCGCCDDKGECTGFAFATACWREIEGSDCATISPPGIWVCAAGACVDGGASILGLTIRYAGRCYVVGTTIVAAAAVPPGAPTVSGLEYECVAPPPGSDYGCLNRVKCGGPPNVCPCLCFNTKEDPEDASRQVLDCCFGRVQRGPVDVGAASLGYARSVKLELQRTRGPGWAIDGGCVDVDCRDSLGCVAALTEVRSTSDVPNPFVVDNDCCRWVYTESRQAVRRRGTQAGTVQFCCSGTDEGSAAWSADAFYIEVCLPSEFHTGPTTTTVVDGATSSGPDGCSSGSRVTTTETRTCSGHSVEVVTENWSYTTDGARCECQFYEKATELTEWTVTPGDTSLCAQCGQAIVDAYTPPGP